MVPDDTNTQWLGHDRLNRWTATFSDPQLEKAFQCDQIDEQRRYFICAAFMVWILGMISSAIDFSSGLIPENFWILVIRITAFGLGVWFLGLGIFRYQSARFSHAVEIYAVIVIGLTFGLLYIHPAYGVIGPINLVCTLFGMYFLLPFVFWRQVFYTLMFTVVGMWGVVVNPSIQIDVTRLGQWLAFVHTVGILGTWERQKRIRLLYAATRALNRRIRFEVQASEHNRALIDLLTHELRNPLAQVQAQLALMGKTYDNQLRRQTQEMQRAIGRAENLIRRWVDGDRALPRPSTNLGADFSSSGVALQPLLQAAVQQVRVNHPHLIVIIDDRFSVPKADIDERVFALVVINLLDNACKYARGPSDQTAVRISLRYRRQRIRVRFKDQGRGIAYDLQDQVFEKHRRLEHGVAGHETIEGTGIGLHLCQTLLGLQGAQLTLQSKPGLGCAFVVDLAQV